MNIVLCHYRTGETDGVSLEMEKWKTVLEKLGHQVFLLSGNTGEIDDLIIPEIGYRHPLALQLEENAYQELKDYGSGEELAAAVMVEKNKIKSQLKKFIREKEISLLIPNNILSLGKNIAAAVAITEIVQEGKIRCLGHHHDFYWERESYARPTCDFANQALAQYFPPDLDNMQHLVINSLAAEELKNRKGLNSTIIPNIFDFEQEQWQLDNYNQDFRKVLGIKDNDIIMLQATRVTNRKAIELAVDLVAEMNHNRGALTGKRIYNGQTFNKQSRIILVLVGMIETSDDYVARLKNRAEEQQVELLFCNELVDHTRQEENGQKRYSLWDTYVHADIITYPSILEGWGNQFLEGLFALKPMVVFEYPVYQRDIKAKGFNIISLGDKYSLDESQLAVVDQEIIKRAAGKVVELLLDKGYYYKFVKENFQLGKKHYSYQILEELLESLIKG